jgi:deazaflavin-dependent oxidoreductase (nitroreductase family)
MSIPITDPRPPSAFARLTRAVARVTAPVSRSLAGHRFFPLWAIVHHRGRRSGRAYAVPVAIRVSDDAFTIALPWGERTQWVRNVIAAGECSIRWRGADHPASAPRLTGFDEASAAFHPAQLAILRAAGVRTFLRLSRG